MIRNSITQLLWLCIVVLVLLPRPSAAKASLPDYGYPRLANLYLKTPLSTSDIEPLSQWDVIVLGMQEQSNSSEIIRAIRAKNPNIKILAYVASEEFPVSRLDVIEGPAGPWHKLYAGIQPDWWLYQPDGQHFSTWPGNQNLNVNSGWNTYLPQFMHDQVMATGLWDGLYYDNVWSTISDVNNGNVDMNRDGVKDDPTTVDAAWKQGMTTMLQTSRNLQGKNGIIVGNGGDDFKPYLNGRLFENFPNLYPYQWDTNVTKYYNFEAHGYLPTLSIINGAPNNAQQDSYQQMRFALTSTLLGNGFFSYDLGFIRHDQLWWYDEYSSALGQPLNNPYNVTNLKNPVTNIKTGVWRRNFQNGIVLVNSTNQTKKIVLEDGFEKILGVQDPAVNNGHVITQVTIPAQDGIILRGRITQVVNVPYVNGTFAKVFDNHGNIIRNNFFSYNSSYAGGTVVDDVTAINNTVVTDSTWVSVYNHNKRVAHFAPYGSNFRGGVNFAVAQLGGSKSGYVIATAPQSQGGQVRLFSLTGKLLNPGAFPYGRNFTGGINLTIGDMMKKNKGKEIIIAPASNHEPRVLLLNKRLQPITKGFLAYNAKITNGVAIAVGDVDNNGKTELAAIPVQGAPYVRVFNAKGKNLQPGFYAFTKTDGSKNALAVSDIDADGRYEIIGMSLNIFNQ